LTIDTLGQTTTLPYDSLILATGATQSYFGHDEYARDAPGLKTVDDALELRGRIFGAFETAELEADDAARQPRLTFAIVGAGATGVELAGQIAELSRRALRANFRRFDPACARIVLLDAVDTVLPSYPPRLRRRARRDLEALGVELRLGTRVVGVDAAGLDIEGGRIEARTKIWAAGVQASSLGRLLADRAQATVDRAGRVQVAPDCSLPGHPEVFVVGDLMALDGLPGVAEVALQSGHHAARTIMRRLHGQEPRPFHYRDLGTMATISRFRAVASIGPIRIAGLAGWSLWLLVHLVFITGFTSPGSRAGSRRWPTGQWRSSGAAGASGPSPSSRCSPGRVPSRRQPPLGDVPAGEAGARQHPLRPGDVNRWRPRRRRAWPG
jgi:NADH dehydrogenase